MPTLDIESLSDRRSPSVFCHDLTTGRSVPTAACRHDNDRGVPNISVETTDHTTGAALPSIWDRYLVHCHRNSRNSIVDVSCEIPDRIMFNKYFSEIRKKPLFLFIFFLVFLTEQVSAMGYCNENKILIKDNLLGWSNGMLREFVLRSDMNNEHSSETGGWVFGNNFPEAMILRLIIYKREHGDEVRYIDLSDLFSGKISAEETESYIFYYLGRRDYPFSICGKETLQCRLSFNYQVYDVEIISLLRNKNNIEHFTRKMISYQKEFFKCVSDVKEYMEK